MFLVQMSCILFSPADQDKALRLMSHPLSTLFN